VVDEPKRLEKLMLRRVRSMTEFPASIRVVSGEADAGDWRRRSSAGNTFGGDLIMVYFRGSLIYLLSSTNNMTQEAPC